MKDIEYFHNENHYNRYLWAIELGKEVNRLLEEGYILFDENNNIVPADAKFVFREGERPGFLFKYSKDCAVTYLDTWADDDCKTFWVRTKKEWRETFNRSFGKAVKPEDVRKVTYG